MNDAPFIVKSSDEFPAGVRLIYAIYFWDSLKKLTCRDRSRCAIAWRPPLSNEDLVGFLRV